jgi:hypothetical protein
VSHNPALTPATLNAMSAVPTLAVNTARPMISAAAISQLSCPEFFGQADLI